MAAKVLHMYSRPTSKIRISALVALNFVLVACAGQDPRNNSNASEPVTRSTSEHRSRHIQSRQSQHERAAVAAVSQVGVPYRYGGASQDGFDCSGLVYFSYQQVGKKVPRTTGSLWQSLPRVDSNDLRAGDVLFFRIAGKVSHVGMYLGERRFVHAPQSGRAVSIARLDSPFYRETFIAAGRP